MTPTFSRARRAFIVLLIMALLLPAVAGCSGTAAVSDRPARYGSFGADFARTLAAANPARTAGSEGESKTADMIINALRDLGFEPIITTFSFKATDGSTRSSRNITVRIPGTGVTVKTGDRSEKATRQVVIGAHYDATATQADIDKAKSGAPATASAANAAGGTAAASGPNWIPTWKDFTGISDNASSIGALLVIARELKLKRNAHDVVLVAFGAGHADQAGARDFVSKMSSEEIARTDVMYNLENIYAGDKLYANAGQNSIRANYQKDYEKRRKLYEVTDIYYEYELYSNNKVALYTNQSVIETDQNRLKIKAPYREWTMHLSDYTPFDEKGVPIVFFESYDYDVDKLENMRESNNPAFTATSGRIAGTPYDSTRFLEQLFESQQKQQTPTPTPAAGAAASSASAASTSAKTTPAASVKTTPGASATPGTATGGAVGTSAAATTLLTPEDDGTGKNEPLEDLLTRRINNTAFIIIMAIRKAGAEATPAPSKQTTATTTRATTSTAAAPSPSATAAPTTAAPAATTTRPAATTTKATTKATTTKATTKATTAASAAASQ